jgi:hypothetical protein
MGGQEAPAASGRSRTRLVIQGVLSLVLVVAIFYYLFTKIDLAQTWAAIAAMTWQELAILGLLLSGRRRLASRPSPGSSAPAMAPDKRARNDSAPSPTER